MKLVPEKTRISADGTKYIPIEKLSVKFSKIPLEWGAGKAGNDVKVGFKKGSIPEFDSINEEAEKLGCKWFDTVYKVKLTMTDGKVGYWYRGKFKQTLFDSKGMVLNGDPRKILKKNTIVSGCIQFDSIAVNEKKSLIVRFVRLVVH